jgi:uncharacterized protein (DUF1330 family)
MEEPTRPAYLVANVHFSDLEKAQEHGRQLPATIVRYGGRYLARGGQTEVTEGDWQLHYVVIVEFPSLEQAMRWYASEEYCPLKLLRLENAESQLAFVEGLPPVPPIDG